MPSPTSPSAPRPPLDDGMLQPQPAVLVAEAAVRAARAAVGAVRRRHRETCAGTGTGVAGHAARAVRARLARRADRATACIDARACLAERARRARGLARWIGARAAALIAHEPGPAADAAARVAAGKAHAVLACLARRARLARAEVLALVSDARLPVRTDDAGARLGADAAATDLPGRARDADARLRDARVGSVIADEARGARELAAETPVHALAVLTDVAGRRARRVVVDHAVAVVVDAVARLASTAEHPAAGHDPLRSTWSRPARRGLLFPCRRRCRRRSTSRPRRR